MAICRIQQLEIFSSGTVDDNLTPANAPTAANLEEDLNYIRSVLKSFFGTANWYDVPSGSMNDVLNAFPVQHYTASDDPTKEGYHKDVIADSITINGDFSINGGDISVTNGGSASVTVTDWALDTGSGSVSVTGGAQTISATTIDETLTGDKTLANTNGVWLRFSAADESIVFSGSLSTDNILLDLQQGYALFSENEGPFGESGGTRLWVTGPDTSGGASGIILGPKDSNEYLRSIRLRSNSTYVEGGAYPLRVTSKYDSATTGALLDMRNSDGDGIQFSVFYNLYTWQPRVSGTLESSRAFGFDDGTNSWFVGVEQYFEINSDTGYIRLGSYNTNWAHLFTDRDKMYISQTTFIDGGIGFYELGSTASYRLYIGSTFPVTPRDGDIWFKV